MREVAGVAKGVAKGFNKADPFQTAQGVRFLGTQFNKLVFLAIGNWCDHWEQKGSDAIGGPLGIRQSESRD